MITALHIWLGIFLTVFSTALVVGAFKFRGPVSQGKKADKSSQKMASQKLAA